MNQLEVVLAVSDLSEASDGCLATAARMAKTAGAQLHVFGGPPAWPGFTTTLRSVFQPARFAARLSRDLDEQIARTCGGVQTSGRVVHTQTFQDLILAHAREIGADLLIVSRSMDHDVLTGAAERSGVPLLVVGREPSVPLRRIVLPITSAVPHRDTVRKALAWAERFHALGCEPDGEHVTTDLQLVQMAYLTDQAGAAAAAVRESSEPHGVSCEQPVTVSWRASMGGPPRARMRDLVWREDNDLIISPIRGRRPGGARARLTATNRLHISEARAPVLLLPTATRVRAAA